MYKKYTTCMFLSMHCMNSLCLCVVWLISMSWCVYVQLFALVGFIVSALWINTVASEVVSVLHLLGIVLRLSNTALGLTLLAWGNSIGGNTNIGISEL